MFTLHTDWKLVKLRELLRGLHERPAVRKPVFWLCERFVLRFVLRLSDIRPEQRLPFDSGELLLLPSAFQGIQCVSSCLS